MLPPSQSPITEFFPPPPIPFTSEKLPPGYFPSLENQVSTGLGASSPTEARQDSSCQLHMCWRPLTSLWMLCGWWLSLWKLPGVQVSWHCWSSYGVSIPFSSFSPSPQLCHRDPEPLSSAWLWVSVSVLVRCWQSLSVDSHARLLSEKPT
jgi:hypothetical protein